jgi:hypothetical protein
VQSSYFYLNFIEFFPIFSEFSNVHWKQKGYVTPAKNIQIYKKKMVVLTSSLVLRGGGGGGF